MDHPQLTGFRLVLKGLFDRCAAAAALIMLAPVMAALAAAIWLHDRGPALFTQVRVGKDGHSFRIYKFRTMVVDAEQRKMQLLDNNDSNGVLFKLRKDPRVTAVGAHLRRWSFDELPQLFNVFLGHMSLVGPRPALPDEAEKYADHVRRRLVVKPGLTGLWQVNAVIKQCGFGQSGLYRDHAASSPNALVMLDAAEQIGCSRDAITGLIGRIASAVARRALRAGAEDTIAERSGRNH